MRAYRQVVSNKGSAGVDGMKINDLYQHLTEKSKSLRARPLHAPSTSVSNGSMRFRGAGSDTSEWQVFRANSKTLMVGCGIV